MEVSFQGTVLNLWTGFSYPISMQFDVSGGQLMTYGADTALMNAHITDFSATVYAPLAIGGPNRPIPLGEPSSFLANITMNSVGGNDYGQLVVTSGNWLTLESNSPLFGKTGEVYGSIGAFYIDKATYQASAPEPSTLVLVGVAVCAALARFVSPLVLRFLRGMPALA